MRILKITFTLLLIAIPVISIMANPALTQATTYIKVDYYEGGTEDTVYLSKDNTVYTAGQTWTASESYTLKRISVPLKKGGGNADTFIISCTIRYVTIGSSSSTTLATSTTTYRQSDLSTSYEWKDFEFSNLSISSGETYAIVLSHNYGYNNSRCYWQGASSGNPYAGGTAFYKDNNYPYYWTALTNKDLNFRTYYSYDLPIVTTQAVTNITEATATGNGNVTSDGGSTITERGTVISTSANPTTADHKDTASGTTGAFTTSITGLSKNTTYHVRAYAINSAGTSYGADVSFTTLTDPTISTQAASQVTATTARLNANVTFDGCTSCTVKFVYKAGTGYANYAAILAAGGTEVSAAGTYTTGGLPYYDVTGLSTSTTYSFAAKITNSVSSAYGSVKTFTTESGVYAPASLTAIPYGTKVSLVWAKGTGSTYSLLRYSPATYPTAVTEGTSGYFGTGNSVQVSGLTPGTTYYWSIWGMSGGTYSSTYTTAICTTLAYDTAISSDINIEVPPSNDTWTQTPSESKLQNVPMANAIVNIWHDTYEVPNSMLWYFIWFMVGIGGGIVLYNKTSYNLIATFGAELVWFGIGSVLGLVMLWIVFVLLIIALGFIVFGHRH